jgi:glycine/D-amino acid oxidase-like deaminating enzyme
MGHLTVLGGDDVTVGWTAAGVALWREVAPTLPADCEHVSTGTLWVAETPSDLDEAFGQLERLAAQGVDARVVGPRELAELEPALRPGLAGALLVPGDGVFYGPRAAAHLLERAASRGATLLTGRRVTAVDDTTLVLEGGGAIRADQILLCTGHETAGLLADVPLRARRGHLAITARRPGLITHEIVELAYERTTHATEGDAVAFNVQPRVTGQILVGSSRELDRDGPEIEPAVLARMLARAVAFLPALADLAVLRAWTGVRAVSPDGRPLIGRHPSRRGMWIAAGHEGLGHTTALVTARLVAALLTGARPPVHPAPFDPARCWPVAVAAARAAVAAR